MELTFDITTTVLVGLFFVGLIWALFVWVPRRAAKRDYQAATAQQDSLASDEANRLGLAGILGLDRPVLVTTKYRGVFFGYVGGIIDREIKLKRARNCLYWSPAVKGFLGLAAYGPDEESRVGPPADIVLHGVTCVAEVTPQAVERWEAAPWHQ